MLKPYHNIEQAIETLYLKGVEIPGPLAFQEIGRMLSVITAQFLNSEKINYRLFGYCSKLLRLLPFWKRECTSIADLCERAWTVANSETDSNTISLLWKLWSENIEHCNLHFLKKREDARCKYSNWKEKYQKEEYRVVSDLCNLISSDFKTFLVDAQVHGSLSDMKLTAYSDLDMLLVIKSEVATDAERLMELRDKIRGLLKYLREFDPLQHHSFFIMTEQEMSCYAESRFPLLLMDYATSLFDSPVLTFNTIDDKMQSAASLYNMARRVSSIDALSSDNYNLKMYTSWIMLLPTFYYQLKNDYVYKADSFKLTKMEFDENEWKAIDAASYIRENWNANERNDLTLLNYEPDIIKKSQKLTKTILNRLDMMTVQDRLWNLVDVSCQSKHYAVDYHPVFYKDEEFASVEILWARNLSQIEGVHSVYSFGTKNVTLGVSDLDLLIVLDDDFSNDIAAKIMNVRKKLKAGITGYIKWHEEIIITKNDLSYQANLWEPAPRFIAGEENLLKDIEPEEDRSDYRKILLFREGAFQFLKMVEFFFTISVPLRLVLLRCNSIKYDIAIASELFNIKHPLSDEYCEEILKLRNNWFHLENDERLVQSRNVLIKGLRILHFILSKTAEEVVDLEGVNVFRGATPVIDLDILKIVFKGSSFKVDSPENINIGKKEISFPLALFPLIELCHQNLKINPQFNLEELKLLVDKNLQEKITIFQNIWAQSSEQEKLILSNS